MDLLKYNPYFVLLAILVIGLVLQLFFILFSRFEKEITVKSKEAYGTRGRNQLVMDTQGNVYSVHNALLLLHFTSAELFNGLEVGKTYTVKGYGVRLPIFGLFPNITYVR